VQQQFKVTTPMKQEIERLAAARDVAVGAVVADVWRAAAPQLGTLRTADQLDALLARETPSAMASPEELARLAQPKREYPGDFEGGAAGPITRDEVRAWQRDVLVVDLPRNVLDDMKRMADALDTTLSRLLPSSKLLVYEGVGHSPHWEVPDRFARDLAVFVDECGRLPVPRSGR